MTIVDCRICSIRQDDKEWIRKFIKKRWGTEKIISRGKVYYPHKLEGFIVVKGKRRLGLITYCIEKESCQIVSLDSLVRRRGIGTKLIEEVKRVAQKAECRKLWCITTNDNLEALLFYQKRGFALVAVYRNALDVSRKLKPEIPQIGKYGIPLKDEIELELALF